MKQAHFYFSFSCFISFIRDFERPLGALHTLLRVSILGFPSNDLVATVALRRWDAGRKPNNNKRIEARLFRLSADLGLMDSELKNFRFRGWALIDSALAAPRSEE